MEFKDHCEWYMIKVGDSYGILYCGPEPAVAFPLSLEGAKIWFWEAESL